MISKLSDVSLGAPNTTLALQNALLVLTNTPIGILILLSMWHNSGNNNYWYAKESGIIQE